MARLKPSGATFATLYEYDTTLDRIIAELGLSPLTREQERLVREKLGAAIGEWLQDGGYSGPDAKLDTRDIANKLRLLAVQLDGLNEAIQPAFSSGLHHSHNTAVASQLLSALELHPIIQHRQSAAEFLQNFSADAKIVADAARVAAKITSDERGAPGRKRMRWHALYREAVVDICEANCIRPTINTDRVSGRRMGRFLDIAMGLQQVLPAEMRAQNEETLVTRLKKAKAQG
jgi:hypothetical protein